MAQVDKEHYYFNKYVTKERWISYYHQIHEALLEQPEDILLIGIGDGLVSHVIEYTNGIKCQTFDYDKTLEPTYLGDIKRIDEYVNNEFDTILCCQVLEHLPFDDFEMILTKLLKICKNKLIISVPCMYPLQIIHVKFHNISFCRTYTVRKFWKQRPNFKFDGEHYWEVGCNGCSKKDILAIIKKYFYVEKEFRNFENGYHWFLVLTPLDNTEEEIIYG